MVPYLYNFIENNKSSDEIPEIRQLKRKKVNFNDILKTIAIFYNKQIKDVVGGGHRRENEARKIAIHLMKKLTGADYQTIAVNIGNATKDSLAQLNHRFQKEMSANNVLRDKCNAIAQNLMLNVKT